MQTPFPGMDPYLEHPRFWPGVPNLLIAEIDKALNAVLPDGYFATIEERLYVSVPGGGRFAGVSDVSVVGATDAGAASASEGGVAVQVPMRETQRETYLEVRGSDDQVITTIELLSPSNKSPGQGRTLYLRKRADTLASWTHLVEVDLLRAGERMPIEGAAIAQYGVLVSRGHRRPDARLYPFGVRDSIPSIPVPLDAGDVEPRLDLQSLVRGVHQSSRYGVRIDYRSEPEPPLDAADAVWAEGLLKARGLRP